MSVEDQGEIVRGFLKTLAPRLSARGVLHVGAHQGQEVEAYLAHGFERIVLVEANPQWSRWLEERWGGDARVRVLHCAATDFDGTVALKLHTSRTGSTEPASVLDMKRFKDVVKTLETRGVLDVPAIRLDSLLEREGLRPSDFDLLNIDIQGAEKLAFRGAPRLLDGLLAVVTEVNVIEMYDGCATEDEIDAILGAHGLGCVARVYHDLYDERGTFPAWGEKLYVRGA